MENTEKISTNNDKKDERDGEKDKICREAVLIERLNTRIEEKGKSDIKRELLIEGLESRMDEIEELEKQSGFSEEEIMGIYKNLSVERARKEVGQMTVELKKAGVNKEAIEQVSIAAKKGQASIVAEKIKNFFPKKRVLLLVVCCLLFSVDTLCRTEDDLMNKKIGREMKQEPVEKVMIKPINGRGKEMNEIFAKRSGGPRSFLRKPGQKKDSDNISKGASEADGGNVE